MTIDLSHSGWRARSPWSTGVAAASGWLRRGGCMPKAPPWSSAISTSGPARGGRRAERSACAGRRFG